ncbi:MAG: hypothetical protein HQL06_17050 [Nitrospirae bacterium]|nr:hypothetical protein [Nitrospirota bacterium]
MNYLIQSIPQIILTASLSIFVSSLDLQRDFSETTLKKAHFWIYVYVLINIAVSIFVFLILHYIDIKINIWKIAKLPYLLIEWSKAILCGMFSLAIFKIRIPTLRISKTDNNINPEKDLKQITDIVKMQIAKKGLIDFVKGMQDLMELGTKELFLGVELLMCNNELWQDIEKKKTASCELCHIKEEKDEQKKKLSLCHFILRIADSNDFRKYLSIRYRLSLKSWSELYNFIEKKLSEEEKAYLETLRKQSDDKDALDYIIELIRKHLTISEIDEFLDKEKR